MIRSIPRAFAVALFGALAGAACLVFAYSVRPGIDIPMDRLPVTGSGFYDAEHEGSRFFAWTGRRAEIKLAGLDRRAEWSCSVSFRGGRAAELPQPDLDIAVDGIVALSRRATNDYQEAAVTVPARPLKPGVVLTFTSSQTFVPGVADRRVLGVQVNRFGCHPIHSVPLPPRPASGAAALAAAALGAALGLTGITAGSAVLATVLVAAGQSVPLSLGAAPYGDYPGTLARLAVWIAIVMVVALKVAEAINRQALRNTARFAIVFSAGAIYLKLLVLLHPSKGVIDAVFHAHRLEWVLAGRYYFTQLSTSATPFPYAIGLYLFAAPWSLLTRDYVTLLRVVVCVCEAIAGALLYLMIVRARGDRMTGAIAVALFSLVPISYVVAGNANLTNAFGQSVGVAAVAAAALLPLQRHHVAGVAVLVLVATLGFISHVSTLVLLLATLVLVAVFYRLLGGPTLRAPARLVAVATVVAGVLAVGLYWGHFGPVYKAQIDRVRAMSSDVGGDPAPGSTTPPRLGRARIPLGSRAAGAFGQTVANLGWPILILAGIGAWRLWKAGGRDTLVLSVMAWATVCLAFVAVSVLTAVDVRYQQDAWEFIARVEHATCPAAVILAAIGATWAWRAGTATRLASCALLFAAVLVGYRAWTAWL